MKKRIILWCGLVLLLAAAADLQVCSAEGDPLASPTPRPTQRVTAPLISGVNPEIITPEGEQGDIPPSGGYPIQIPIRFRSIEMPAYVGLVPLKYGSSALQIEETISRGLMALVFAMNQIGEGGSLEQPTSSQLETFLRERSALNNKGPGVEDLAAAAQAFGYQKAQAFYRLRLEDLALALKNGPLVVPLGGDEQGQTGRFVVLTGTSPDKLWFYCTDPDRGHFRLSREIFLGLWDLQDRAGVVLIDSPFSTSAGSTLPWMGLISAVSILALALKQTAVQAGPGRIFEPRKKPANLRRKRYMGDDLPPGSFPTALLSHNKDPSAAPDEDIRERPDWGQIGFRGIKWKVPVYQTRRVQVGFRKTLVQVPVYKKIKLYRGTRLVAKKVPLIRYRTKKVWTWKKVVQRVPITRRFGSKKLIIAYREQARWKRVQIEKRVPYRTTKVLQVTEPVYETKKVQSGLKTVSRWVPKYKENLVLVGYKAVNQTIPVFLGRGIPPRGGEGNGPEPGGDQQGSAGGITHLTEREQRLKELLFKNRAPREEIEALLRKGIGPEWPQEGGQQLTDNWLYKTILFFQDLKDRIGAAAEKLGAPKRSGPPPHLFSFSADKEAPINLLNEGGIRVNSYHPPHYLDLFYTRQKLEMGPKVVITAYPDGLMNLNLSKRSLSIKIGKKTLFAALDGRFGFGSSMENPGSAFDEEKQSVSIHFSGDGISVQTTIEGAIIIKKSADPLLEVKEVRTLKSDITTIRTLGILVGVLAALVLAALLYLYYQVGIPIRFPLGFPL